MPRSRPDDRSKTSPAHSPRREASSATALLTQRSLDLDAAAKIPEVHLRSVMRHPLLFRKLVRNVDPQAKAGDLVAVYTPQGELFGHGLYNPRAEIAVRMLQFSAERPAREFWREKLNQAVRLRRDLLRLDATTNAYRLVHAEADGLSGLVIDRYGDVLSAEVFSLAMFQRSHALLQELAAILGTRHTLVQVAPQTHGQEGFLADPVRSPNLPAEIVIEEYGTKFRIRFEGGHKTGFFCDQRENRQRVAELAHGRSVLDLCCYTGGFAVQASKLGRAAEVTAVDLDEKAIELAKTNAKLNQARVQFVHADAFGYMRDMLQNGRRYDVVVLDPPKLIRSRREVEEGTKKHLDLNRLAVQLVAPGGVLLTCTCSGLLPNEEFTRLVLTAARQGGRSVQILAHSGAAADHPVSGDCPETEYLKAVWLRVVD